MKTVPPRFSLFLLDDLRHLIVAVVRRRGEGEKILSGERASDLILPVDILHRKNRRDRLDAFSVHFVQQVHIPQNVRELVLEAFPLLVRELQPRKLGDVFDLFFCKVHGWWPFMQF